MKILTVTTMQENKTSFKKEIEGDYVIYTEELQRSADGALMLPSWMDCTWRRVACGTKDCPLCVRVTQNRARHLEKGEDPDGPEARLEDVALCINAAMVMVREGSDKHVLDNWQAEYGAEGPQLQNLPQGWRTVQWCRRIVRLGKIALADREAWLLTEAAADLFWYVDTLAMKVARQLVNRWEVDNGDKDATPDYEYTRKVIRECVRILQAALDQLALLDSGEKAELISVLMDLRELKEVVCSI
jgi:hypothetical protein